MKFSTTTLFSIIASVALAQDLSLIPACSRPCFTNALSVSSCSAADFACLCGDAAYFADVQLCTLTGCSLDDAIATLNWASATCAAVGVPLKKRILGRKH